MPRAFKKYMKILGVRVDNFYKQELLQKVERFLETDSFHQVSTINPEIVLQAQKDLAYREILNGSQLCVADGTGIGFAMARFGKKLRQRLTGADLIHDILEVANRKNYPIFIIANSSGLSGWREIQKAILGIYPHLCIEGIDLDKNESRILRPIEDQYRILFCTFGAPYQEKFIHSLKERKNSRIRLAIGVGGGFDFLTGKITRAPKFLQKLGLEWLWRFFQEPGYRAKRIFFAVVIFPVRVIFNK